MSMAIDKYLDRVMACANIKDPQYAASVRKELQGHLDDKVRQLQQQGMPVEDANFQAIEDMGDSGMLGYSIRPRFPLIDVRLRGTARGFIAVGPKAVGVFAFGGMAMGVFAYGGLAIGMVSWGGLALALLWCWGGFAISTGFALGGLALGLFATGGLATGVMAVGGMAIGLWAAGDQAYSRFAMDTLPTLLQKFANYLPMNGEKMMMAMAVCLPIFIVLMAIQIILSVRESRRMGGIDPKWVS